MQAVTGTVDGDLVVWEEQGLGVEPGTRATDRQAIKVIKIQRSSVTCLGVEGDYLVSGGKGQVQFFDPLMRLVAWFDDVGKGQVTSVSFSIAGTIKSNATKDLDDTNRWGTKALQQTRPCLHEAPSDLQSAQMPVWSKPDTLCCI